MSSRPARSIGSVLRGLDLGTVVRRSARLASCPGRDQVHRRREREQTGGPPAPHNSVDQSVILLDDTLQERPQVQEEEVFVDLEEPTRPVPAFVPDPSVQPVQPGPDHDPDSVIVIGDTDTEEDEDPSESSRSQSSDLSDISTAPSGLELIDLTDSPGPAADSVSSPSTSHQSQEASTPQCAICLETFTALRNRGRQLVSTVCGHVFCRRCLVTCLTSQPQCPTCRRRLDQQDYHVIYL